MRTAGEPVLSRRRTFIQTLLTSAGIWGLAPWRSAAAAQSRGGAQAAVAGTRSDDEIRRASDEWFDALREADIPTIERFETEDFLAIQEAAAGVAVVERATQIASFNVGKTTRVRLRRELSKVRIRHYGDSAILTAVAVFRRDGDSAQAPGNRAVVTEVWIRQNSRWRIAHFATHPVHDRGRR